MVSCHALRVAPARTAKTTMVAAMVTQSVVDSPVRQDSDVWATAQASGPATATASRAQ